MQSIEDLDKALEGLPPGNDDFWRKHYELQRICASQMRLPLSHAPPNNSLKPEEHPFTSGGFSDIYKGEYGGRLVCIKKLRVASDSNPKKVAELLCREALLWKRLSHPNIVPFIGATIDPPQILSEWMPGGKLTTHINSNPNADRVALLVDIASGLEYLHSLNVIHRDLKGPNILINSSGRACITDFGLAQNIPCTSTSDKVEGQSARWTAPELLGENGTPSKESDVFSFAMVMIEVFTGTVPFNDDPALAAVMTIMGGKRPPRPTHSKLTDSLWELIEKCWRQEQGGRPRISEVSKTLNSYVPPQTTPSERPQPHGSAGQDTKRKPNKSSKKNSKTPPQNKPNPVNTPGVALRPPGQGQAIQQPTSVTDKAGRSSDRVKPGGKKSLGKPSANDSSKAKGSAAGKKPRGGSTTKVTEKNLPQQEPGDPDLRANDNTTAPQSRASNSTNAVRPKKSAGCQCIIM